jgi:hypothetical protein
MKLFSSELLNTFIGLINKSTDIFVSQDTLGNPSPTIRVPTCSLTTALLRIKNLVNFHMKIAASVGLVDDLCLNRTAVNLRVVIIDRVPELLHVLCRLMLKLRIPKHITNLLKMIRRF